MPIDSAFENVYMDVTKFLAELKKIPDKNLRLFTMVNNIQTGKIFIVDKEGYILGWLDVREGHLIWQEMEDKRIKEKVYACYTTVNNLISLVQRVIKAMPDKGLMVYGRTVKQNGNLPLVLPDGRQIGYIAVGSNAIEWDRIPAKGEYQQIPHIYINH
jgi:hypothetical protein